MAQPSSISAPAASLRREDAGSWQIGDAEGGWWAVERLKLVNEKLVGVVPSTSLVVDIGCGRGEAVESFVAAGAGFVVGCDVEAHPRWQTASGRLAYVVADANHLPLRAGVADLVTAFDVIEHFPDDGHPLNSAHTVARPNGHVAITVPATPRLWSPFDDAVGHHRRYTAATLDAAMRAAHLEPSGTTYFFSWLVVPAWLLRKKDRSGADATVPGVVGRLTGGLASLLCRVERAVLRWTGLPFGTSLWTLSRRVSSE